MTQDVPALAQITQAPLFDRQAPLPAGLRYALALVFVGGATVLAFVTDHLIQIPNLSLIYVLPVMLAAMSLGWGPALVASLASALTFDFLFIQPLYTLRVADPADLWALALLVVVAAAVSALAAQSRRRALDALRAADQAQALQALAQVVLDRPEPAVVSQASAAALSRIFHAPAVVLVEDGPVLRVAAQSDDAPLTEGDREAARVALASAHSTRAQTYPTTEAMFDFWPLGASRGPRTVLGVRFADLADSRPADPGQLVEVVGAYLTVASAK